jgi:hypothetical protein
MGVLSRVEKVGADEVQPNRARDEDGC